MTTAYTSLLGLALPVTGELSGTWGDTVNDYLTTYVDAAVAGAQTISGSQTAVTLSKTTGSSLSQAGSGSTGSSQYAIINCTGNPAGLLTITAPAASKAYLILNNTSTSQSVKIVGVGPTTGITVGTGQNALVAWNGSDFELIATIDASKLSGILSVANGGTGISSGTSGGIPYYSGTTTIASSAALAANALVVGGGAGVAPSTVTTGTGVVTALGVNIGTAGSFVVNGGALGTPSSGTVTNLTGTASININGTVGATTPNTGAFTSITSTSASGVLTRAAATQDGVELIGRSGGTSSYKVTFTPTTLSANRTLTLPDNSGTVLTTGATIAVNQGGTGETSYTDGQLLIGNTAGGLTKSTLTAGTGVSITNGDGSITINATGTSGVTSFSAGSTGFTPSTSTTGAVTLAGTLQVDNGGTGQTSYTNGQLLIGNTTGNTLTKATLTAGSGISITNGTGSITIAATGGTGTVTSVAVSGGTTGLTVSGSPITTSGTITLGGVLDVDNGGTGQSSYTNGQLLIGNTTGNTLTKATLTAGTGISVTNGAGAITVAVSGGPTFSAYKDGGNQSVTTATPAKVTLDTEEYDTANAFDTSTSRFTPQTAGYYLLEGVLRAASGTGTTGNAVFTVELRKNGLSTAGNVYRGNEIQMYAPSSDDLYGQVIVSTLIYFNGTTDYVEMWGQLISNGSTPRFLDDYGSGVTCRLQGTFIRP